MLTTLMQYNIFLSIGNVKIPNYSLMNTRRYSNIWAFWIARRR